MAVIFVNTECKSRYANLSGKKLETTLFQRYLIEIENSLENARSQYVNGTPDQRQYLEKILVRDVKWKDAEKRGKVARKLFEEELKFKNVTVHYNLSKNEIIKQMSNIR